MATWFARSFPRISTGVPRDSYNIRTTDRNGPVVGVVSVREGDDIMLITTGGMVNRTHVREVRVVGRNTQGVRLMNPKDGDKIASLAKVVQEDEVESPPEG